MRGKRVPGGSRAGASPLRCGGRKTRPWRVRVWRWVIPKRMADSALDAVTYAEKQWVRVAANMALGRGSFLARRDRRLSRSDDGPFVMYGSSSPVRGGGQAGKRLRWSCHPSDHPSPQVAG